MRYVNIFLPLSEPRATMDERVERIIQALSADSRTRDVVTPGAAAHRPAYTTVSALAGAAPAADMPLLNEDIGVLAIPAPAGGMTAVQDALSGVMTGLTFEESGEVHTQER